VDEGIDRAISTLCQNLATRHGIEVGTRRELLQVCVSN
jgi:hypothetical protein